MLARTGFPHLFFSADGRDVRGILYDGAVGTGSSGIMGTIWEAVRGDFGGDF